MGAGNGILPLGIGDKMSLMHGNGMSIIGGYQVLFLFRIPEIKNLMRSSGVPDHHRVRVRTSVMLTGLFLILNAPFL